MIFLGGISSQICGVSVEFALGILQTKRAKEVQARGVDPEHQRIRRAVETVRGVLKEVQQEWAVELV
jgi:hypothetical protein